MDREPPAKRARAHSEDSLSDDSDDDDLGLAALRLEQLLTPETVESFTASYWEPGRVFTSQLSEELLAQLLNEGFHSGDPTAVLESCRRQDNTCYSADDEVEDGGSVRSRSRCLFRCLCYSLSLSLSLPPLSPFHSAAVSWHTPHWLHTPPCALN